MTELKKSILNKIKDGEITQTSAWYFASRDYFFFFLSGFTAVLGMFAVAATIQRLFIEHMLELKAVPINMEYIQTSVVTFPYVWTLMFVGFCFIAWLNYHYTSSAYKQRNSLVILAVVVTSIIGGAVLFNVGVGERIDNNVRDRIPLYREHVVRQDMRRANFLRDMNPALYKTRLDRINQAAPVGIMYVGLNPQCQTMKFMCAESQEFYSDRVGCGCKSR